MSSTELACPRCGHLNRRGPMQASAEGPDACERCYADMATGRVHHVHKLGVYASYYGLCALVGVGAALAIALAMRVFLERAAWVDVLIALTLVLGAAGGLGFAERNRRRGNFPPPYRK